MRELSTIAVSALLLFRTLQSSSVVGFRLCAGSCMYSRHNHQNTHSICRRITPSLSVVNNDESNVIDADVEEIKAGLTRQDDSKRLKDIFKNALRDLASLSLVDYKWRSALFKNNEAERAEEEWMAAMMGEDAPYARPMDASDDSRGPLGNAEKSAVQWLMDVIEEEGKRARRIAESDGELIRPKDLSPTDEAGPLSDLERKAVQFLNEITDSEVERVQSKTCRPKDMETRGPLGVAEARAVLALGKIIESEQVRMNQTKRSGEVVRPIDVPGPFGEFERYVGDIIRSEQQRVKDREANAGKLVRPKDASLASGLGDVERKAVEDWELLKKEEKQRLFSLQQFMIERRPMERDADSPLGVTEAFFSGLCRVLAAVVDSVNEFLTRNLLKEDDQNLIPPPSEMRRDESTEQQTEDGVSKGDVGVKP